MDDPKSKYIHISGRVEKLNAYIYHTFVHKPVVKWLASSPRVW
jgi:hypothetical protein